MGPAHLQAESAVVVSRLNPAGITRGDTETKQGFREAVTEVTGVTEVTQVTGVTEVTEVTGVTGVTEVPPWKENGEDKEM